MSTKHHVFILLVLLCVSSFLTIIIISRIPMPWFSNQLCFTYISVQENDLSSVLNPRHSLNSSRCPNAELVYGDYCAVNFWKMAARSNTHSNQVTLCTQGTREFLHHISAVCSRWQGPISVAVYCPTQEEYDEATRRILELRECDSCVHSWVDWHLFYDQSSQPHKNESQDNHDCATSRKPKTDTEKPKRNGTYPINVGRNLARWNAKTPYVFPSDIELYPSHNVLYRFELMLKSKSFPKTEHAPGVYVLPVFEVWSKFEPPKTKDQLRVMFQKKHAISFHRFRCDVCHRIPNLTEWLNYPQKTLDGATRSDFRHQKALNVWKTVKRSKEFKLQFWEPFFIAKNDIPEFDSRLSWEGKQNKMQLAYEMCLLGYDFHILDDAYLVHAPGVNSFRPEKEKFRQKHVGKNVAIMKAIMSEFAKKYKPNKEC